MFRPRTLIVLAALLFMAHGEPAAAAVSTLRLTVTGTGAAVEASPAGRLLGCAGAACTYAYRPGTVVSLNAPPNVADASLATWLGACTGSGPTCSVPVTGRRVVSARFTPVRIYTDEQTGQGSVTAAAPGVPCAPNCWAYPYGSRVMLMATPAAGSMLRRWYGNCSPVGMSPTCGFKAFFNLTTSPGFDCATTPCDVGQPTRHAIPVTYNVVGGGGIKVNGRYCQRGTCTRRYWRDTTLSLLAYTTGTFKGWSGGCTGIGRLCQLDLSGDTPPITATFG